MTMALVSLISVIAGALLNHQLTRSGQTNKWILEERKQEARELLTALTEQFDATLRFRLRGIEIASEQRKLLDEADRKANRALRDRIFLAQDVKQNNLLRRWIDAKNAFSENFEVNVFADEIAAISDSIVKAATKGTKTTWK